MRVRARQARRVPAPVRMCLTWLSPHLLDRLLDLAAPLLCLIGLEELLRDALTDSRFLGESRIVRSRRHEALLLLADARHCQSLCLMMLSIAAFMIGLRMLRGTSLSTARKQAATARIATSMSSPFSMRFIWFANTSARATSHGSPALPVLRDDPFDGFSSSSFVVRFIC